jgi:hypothetical protein
MRETGKPCAGLCRATEAGLHSDANTSAAPDHHQRKTLKMAIETVNQPATKQVNLAGWRYLNWSATDEDAPVIANPNASLHACIAWCWGEIAAAHELVASLINDEFVDAGPIFAELKDRVMGAEAMLDSLSDRTRA